jgi:hypothetical protein
MARKIPAGRGSAILHVFLSSQFVQGSRSARIEKNRQPSGSEQNNGGVTRP